MTAVAPEEGADVEQHGGGDGGPTATMAAKAIWRQQGQLRMMAAGHSMMVERRPCSDGDEKAPKLPPRRFNQDRETAPSMREATAPSSTAATTLHRPWGLPGQDAARTFHGRPVWLYNRVANMNDTAAAAKSAGLL